MIVLAIEQSTPVAGLALFRDGQCLAEATWEDARFHNQHLFEQIPRLLDSNGTSLAEVDVFAVGLGPGSFAGLRVALAAARAIALPDGRQVFGVSSGEALAWDVGRGRPEKPVVIAGDARRDRVWFGVFSAAGQGRPKQRAPYALARMEELGAQMPSPAIVATPDWNRMGERLKGGLPAGVEIVEKTVFPRARALGQVVLARMQHGEPSDPLAPIYLHPPVFVEAKY